MADPVLSVGSYALGVVWIGVVAAAVATTWRFVARGLGRPAGAIGAVAGTVAALGQLTLTGQLLGAIGLLGGLPFAATMALEGAVAWWWLRRHPDVAGTGLRGSEPPDDDHPERDGVGTVTALAAVALVGLQWVTHTVDALDRGMTHPDTLWYHAPYSARFLQMGSLGDLGQLGYAQSRYFPLGSELLHTEAALPFHRDLLSPLVNLAFFALSIAAALAIGRRWRAGPTAVLAVVVVLGLPAMAGTQPGQASNDVVVAALLLSSVALVLHVAGRAPWFGVAGLALGLAMGAKVTVVAVAGVLVVGVALHAAGAARGTVRWWLVGAALPVLAWPIRNLVVAGSPLPFFDVHLGPVQWDAVTDRGGPSFVEDLLHDEPLGGTAGWGLLSGIRLGLGPLWPLVLALLLGGLVAVVRGPRQLRPAAVAGAVGAVVFTLLPNTGGSSFQFNLRYLTPALVLAAVTTAAWIGSHRLARQIATFLLAAIVVVNLFAAHHERVDAWPLPPVATMALALAGTGTALLLRRRPGSGFGRLPLTGAAALAIGGGWIVQEHNLDHRYVAVGLHDDVLHAAFREISGAEVHVLGSPEAYPFFGADLSNVVVDHSDALVHGTTAPDDVCRHWRTQLRGADRIVLSEFGFIQRRFSAEERRIVFADDPAVTTLFDDGSRAIYQVDGDLDPGTCPPI